MTNSTVELQAKMYAFDLGNCAREFWFKDDESWDLCLASGEQKAELERRYHPTISKKGHPETLFKLHSLVTSTMQKENPHIVGPAVFEEAAAAPEFLIAFNRTRLR